MAALDLVKRGLVGGVLVAHLDAGKRVLDDLPGIISILADKLGGLLGVVVGVGSDGLTKEQVEDAADAAGQSVNAYILDAVRERMQR